MRRVKFKQWECIVGWSAYTNGRTAIVLNDASDGERVAVATVNVPDVWWLGEKDVLIKDYLENEGMVNSLVEAGIIAKPHDTIQLSPWASAQVARLRVTPGD